MPATVVKVFPIIETSPWRAADKPAGVSFPLRYAVKLSAPDVINGRATALTATDGTTSIPALGAALGSTVYFVRQKEAAFISDKDAANVIVTVWYAAADRTEGSESATPPWQRDAVVDFDSTVEEIESQWDLDGNKFKNTAGAPYSFPIRVPKGATLITWATAKLRSAFNPFLARGLVGKFNASSFVLDDGVSEETFAAKAVQLIALRTRKNYWAATGNYYYDVSFVMAEKINHLNESGAAYDNTLLRIASMGTSQFKTGGTLGVDFEPITETDPTTGEKLPVTSARYLDSSGRACAVTSAAFTSYTVGKTGDWSGLF
jgi:hypothetical protein